MDQFVPIIISPSGNVDPESVELCSSDDWFSDNNQIQTEFPYRREEKTNDSVIDTHESVFM